MSYDNPSVSNNRFSPPPPPTPTPNKHTQTHQSAPGEESREESKRFAEAFMEKQKLKPKSERNPLKSMVPEVRTDVCGVG